MGSLFTVLAGRDQESHVTERLVGGEGPEQQIAIGPLVQSKRPFPTSRLNPAPSAKTSFGLHQVCPPIGQARYT